MKVWGLSYIGCLMTKKGRNVIQQTITSKKNGFVITGITNKQLSIEIDFEK
jgi:hypothetical protein